jgi:predicted Zn finger-like uncharacterized protein
MPLVIHCENCRASLKLPEQYLGQEVRCPSCNKTFTAKESLENPPPRPPSWEPDRSEEAPRPRRDDDRPPRRFDDEDRRRRDYDDDYGPPRRRRYYDDRAYVEPHRGTSILTMGVLSMVFFCFFPLAIGLGIGAIVMANNDLAKMRSGTMDRSGQGTTQAGLVCGVIGLIIEAIILFLSCMNAMNH